jgi:hypothetical protein
VIAPPTGETQVAFADAGGRESSGEFYPS